MTRLLPMLASLLVPSLALAADDDADGYPTPYDCDDLDASIYPGAQEFCDGRDEDCDGVVDDGCTYSTYGYGYGYGSETSYGGYGTDDDTGGGGTGTTTGGYDTETTYGTGTTTGGYGTGTTTGEVGEDEDTGNEADPGEDEDDWSFGCEGSGGSYAMLLLPLTWIGRRSRRIHPPLGRRTRL